MEHKGVMGSLAIAMLLSGALFRGLLAQSTSASAQAQPPLDSSVSREGGAPSGHLGSAGDTLDILATSFTEDVSPAAQRIAIANAVRTLDGSSVLGTPTREDARSLIRALVPPGDQLTTDAAIVARARRALDRGFDQLDPTRLKLVMLKQAATARHIDVRFLIATLPDPVDSYTGWQFDPMLDAITQAISGSDYLLERFHFPDVDAERSAAAGGRRGEIHEDEPGLVLFRKHTEFQTWASERLVLLLVHENPSAGIHVPALVSAIGLAADWTAGQPDHTIRILGPTFSGSSYSLARALTIVGTRATTPDFWVMSGSATDPVNKVTIEGALSGAGSPRRRVTFQATVQPDSVLIRRLVEHIAPLGWSQRMAVLFEGNTQYGRAMLEQLEQMKAETDVKYHVAPESSEVMQLPFPMNISHLRTTAQAVTSTQTWGLPSRFRPLSMEQSVTAVDQIHEFFPKTAGSYLELALSGMLQTVRRERFGTVVLMATDPRDKLFLAQQVARYSPNVSMVTAESDSLYTHPDYASSLQGALVASTYSLYTGNQRWSYGFQGGSERRQFANGSSQGIYNAALALLHYEPSGNPSAHAGNEGTPSLLEYGPPGDTGSAGCAAGCQPPIWISVVGRDAVWPVQAYPILFVPPSESSAAGYTFTARAAPTASPAGIGGGLSRARAVTFVSPLFGLLTILVIAVAVGSALIVPRLLSGAASWLSLGIGLAGILEVAGFIATLWVARARAESSIWSISALIALALSVVVGTGLAVRTRLGRRTRQTDAQGRESWWTRLIGVTVCGLGMWGGANLFVYAVAHAAAPVSESVGFLTRALDLASGVSPTIPVVCLAAAVSLFAVIEQIRRRSAAAALTDANVHPLLEQAVSGNVETLSERWTYLNRSIIALPWQLTAIIAVASLATALFAFNPFTAPLVTLEGPAFGRFVTSLLVIMQLLIGLSLMQFVYLWYTLKLLLDRLAWHRLADAYQRVSPKVFPANLFPSAPRFLELQTLVRHCMDHWPQRFATTDFMSSVPRVSTASSNSEMNRVFDTELRTSPDRRWSQSETWTQIVEVATQPEMATTRGALARAGIGHGYASLDTIARHANEPSPEAAHAREDLQAMAIAFIVRDALSRLSHHLLFIVAAVFLVFCSHTLFPFQAREHLQAMGWTYVGLTFTAIVTVLVQMKRHEVLSRLSSLSAEGRTTWDGALVLKLAIFALVPLLSLFAAQFPEVGGLVLHWLEPVEKALP